MDDRDMEFTEDELVTLDELRREYGIQVYPIVTVRDIIAYLHNRPVDGKVYIYSVFSGYKSGGARFIHNVNTRECTQSMFYDFLAEIKEKSLLKQELEFNEKSKIATLVTCTNAPGKPDERWVLHCLLTEIVELD